MMRATAAFTSMIVLLAAFFSCDGSSREMTVPSKYRVVLRVGYANEPPYSYKDSVGQVTGESPEALKAAARTLRIKEIRWVLMSFSSLMDELEAGRIDAVAAGLFVTPARQARVRFSMPTALILPGLLVEAGNPLDLHSYKDAAANPQVAVAVLDGAVEQETLSALGMPPERIYACQDVETALTAMRSGRVAALALSQPTVGYLAAHSEGHFEAADMRPSSASDRTQAPDKCALAFRKQDEELASAFDKALSAYVGSPEHRSLLIGLGFGPDSAPAH